MAKYLNYGQYNNFWIPKKITFKDENFIQSTIYKLIYLEKTNLLRYKSAKQTKKTLHIDVNIKLKKPRLNTESI